MSFMERSRERDDLAGALIGLARACVANGKTEDADAVLLAGLRALGNGGREQGKALTEQASREKNRICPGCALCTSRCGNTDDYEMERMWRAEESVRGAKLLIWERLCRMAALGGALEEEERELLYKGLYVLAEDWPMEQLLDTALELPGPWGEESGLPRDVRSYLSNHGI